MDECQKSRELERALAGDADALQRLILHYHATLRGVVAAAIDASLRRHVDPDDVLQEAYISVFKALNPNRDREGPAEPTHHFDGPGHLYKWLEQIALNRLSMAALLSLCASSSVAPASV